MYIGICEYLDLAVEIDISSQLAAVFTFLVCLCGPVKWCSCVVESMNEEYL